MNAGGTRQKSAFTLIEVIAIAVAIALFLVLMLVGVQHVKREALRKRCEDNLRTMGISIRGYGMDPAPDSYMMALANMTRTSPHLGDTRRYFMEPQMTNELKTPKTLICPADSVRTPAKSFPVLANTNISYFVGIDSGDTIPKSITAGDDNIRVNGLIPLPGLLQIATNSPVVWTKQRHKNCGNLLFGDGTVQRVSSPGLGAALEATTFPFYRLAMP